jgi:drug/metabolite transporter (DMT)-like permease
MRGAASLPFVLLAVAFTGRWRDLRPVRWGLHLLRGLLAIVMLGTFVYAVRLLPLADAYSIFLTAPLIVTALSVPFLGEHVDARRWIAVGIGLSGSLVLLNPNASSLASVGALAAIASATCYALSAISVRVLTRTDTTTSMVFWFMVSLAVFGGALAAPSWVAIDPRHWLTLLGLGLLGALGQHFVTEAFRHARASVVAPFEYTAMLWAIAIDWFFWRHAPNSRMLAGGLVIIGSGLYLIHRERRERRERRQ